MPWQPEYITCLMLRVLASGMYSGMTAGPEAAATLRILADLDTSLGPAAHLALTLGIHGDTADVRAAAGDALIAAATNARLDPTNLAAAWIALAEVDGTRSSATASCRRSCLHCQRSSSQQPAA